MDTARSRPKHPKTNWFHPKALVPKHPELGQHTKGWSDWPSATPLGVELESSGLGSSRPAILFCREIIPKVSDELDLSLVLKTMEREKHSKHLQTM